MPLAEIGHRIAEARQFQHLTQQELAQRAGITRATLSRLENGHLGEMGFTRLSKILFILGLELTLRTSNRGRPTLAELLAEQAEEDYDD